MHEGCQWVAGCTSRVWQLVLVVLLTRLLDPWCMLCHLQDHFLNAANWMWLSATAFFNQYYRVYRCVHTLHCLGVADIHLNVCIVTAPPP